MAFTWKPSYGEATKLIIDQWANAWVLQTVPQIQTTVPNGNPPAPVIFPELTQGLQRLTDDLANVQQQIEQLKASQEQITGRAAAIAEQIKKSQEQMGRDNAKAVEQLNAALAQMGRRNAAVAEQLKATQEQLAEVASSQAAGYARKPMSRLSSLQKRARAKSRVR
jgi:predicted  nucleic acid-binding Zn-ribbon protein